MANKIYFKTNSGQYIDLNKALSPDDKFAKVMREFKEGKLKTSDGKIVTDIKQAKAIAMSESGQSMQKAKATIGTVATWADGKQYRKVAENQWEPDHSEKSRDAKLGGGVHGYGKHDVSTAPKLHKRFMDYLQNMSQEHRDVFRGGKFDFEKKTFTAIGGKIALHWKDDKVNIVKTENLNKAHNIVMSRSDKSFKERISEKADYLSQEFSGKKSKKEKSPEPKKESQKEGSAQADQEKSVIKGLKDAYRNKSERQLKELLKSLKENPEHNSLRIKAIEEIIKPKSSQAKYDKAKNIIKQFEDDENKSDYSPEEWQAYLKESKNDRHNFNDAFRANVAKYEEAVKNLSKYKEEALDEAGQGKMFKATQILREELMFKAQTTKYIKRIPNPKGKGWIYFYTQDQVKAYQKDGTIPDQKKKPELEKPGADNKREVLKNALKKIGNIFAEALSGKDSVQPTGAAVEETGANIKENAKQDQKQQEIKKRNEELKKKETETKSKK